MKENKKSFWNNYVSAQTWFTVNWCVTPAAMPNEFELENAIIWVNKGVSYHIAMALKKLFIMHSIQQNLFCHPKFTYHYCLADASSKHSMSLHKALIKQIWTVVISLDDTSEEGGQYLKHQLEGATTIRNPLTIQHLMQIMWLRKVF